MDDVSKGNLDEKPLIIAPTTPVASTPDKPSQKSGHAAHAREKSAVEKHMVPLAVGAGGLVAGGLAGVFVHPLLGGALGIGVLVADYFFLVRAKPGVRAEKTVASAELEKKKDLLQQMDFLEKQFLKREIDEPSYQSLREQKERELIALEAELAKSNAKKSGDEEKQLAQIEDSKAREELRAAFEKRHGLVVEMDVAQNHFLKRQIDSKTYGELTKDHQKKLAEIESKIRSLSAKNETDRILSDLKKDLARLESAKPKTPKHSPVLAQALAEEQLADQITQSILNRYKTRGHR